MSFAIGPEVTNRVRDIALRAGAVILDIYNTDFGVETKEDASPVTAADRSAEALIVDALRREVSAEFPIIAEEEVADGRIPEIDGGPFWLVDPLDGTKEFVKRRGEFTVNIALIEGGRPCLGVVHAPAKNATYWASSEGAFAETDGSGSRAIACRPMPEKDLIAVASKSHRNPELEAYLARYDLAESIAAGSSIKFCLVAAGLADLYPRTGRTMEWDTAAGHAIVRFAGGSVTDMQGNELTYGKPGFENPHFVVRGAQRRP